MAETVWDAFVSGKGNLLDIEAFLVQRDPLHQVYMDFLSRSTALCCCQPNQTKDRTIQSEKKQKIIFLLSLPVLLPNAGADGIDGGVGGSCDGWRLPV